MKIKEVLEAAKRRKNLSAEIDKVINAENANQFSFFSTQFLTSAATKNFGGEILSVQLEKLRDITSKWRFNFNDINEFWTAYRSIPHELKNKETINLLLDFISRIKDCHPDHYLHLKEEYQKAVAGRHSDLSTINKMLNICQRFTDTAFIKLIFPYALNMMLTSKDYHEHGLRSNIAKILLKTIDQFSLEADETLLKATVDIYKKIIESGDVSQDIHYLVSKISEKHPLVGIQCAKLALECKDIKKAVKVRFEEIIRKDNERNLLQVVTQDVSYIKACMRK